MAKKEILKSYSQKLRREMTKEEAHIWYDFLKKLPITVNRQKVIGDYIVDFYIAEFKIVIEIDGAQHYDGENREHDKERDEYFDSRGILVLRYTNGDIRQRFSSVCSDVLRAIDNRS